MYMGIAFESWDFPHIHFENYPCEHLKKKKNLKSYKDKDAHLQRCETKSLFPLTRCKYRNWVFDNIHPGRSFSKPKIPEYIWMQLWVEAVWQSDVA